MLEAKTKEQREHVEKIVEKYTANTQACYFLSADVYRNYEESVEMNLKCMDCDCILSVDIRFDMMAEIVDYLREQNNKQTMVTRKFCENDTYEFYDTRGTYSDAEEVQKVLKDKYGKDGTLQLDHVYGWIVRVKK